MAKVLVVDDSADIRDMIIQVLTTFGYEVTGTSLKDDVNSLISCFKPQLILLDVWFGINKATEIYKQIKSAYKKLPVILMSADGDLESHYKDDPADDYLEKPFDIMALKDKVELLLHKECFTSN